MTKRLTLIFAVLLAFAVPPPASAQNRVFDDLVAARKHYQTPMAPEEQAALLNEVAWRNGLGLERKDGIGNNCPQPQTGIRVACDILRFPNNRGRDVLQDAEGVGRPDWGKEGPADVRTFVEPVDPGTSTKPDDPPPPPFLEVMRAISTLSVRLDQLAQQIDGLARFVADDHLSAILDHLAELRQQVMGIQPDAIVFPVYRGRLLNQTFTLTPEVK